MRQAVWERNKGRTLAFGVRQVCLETAMATLTEAGKQELGAVVKTKLTLCIRREVHVLILLSCELVFSLSSLLQRGTYVERWWDEGAHAVPSSSL